MNPKIPRLKAEYQKNTARITRYQNRNEDILKEVTELENLDIIGLVRSVGMTPEQLEALIAAGRTPGGEQHA